MLNRFPGTLCLEIPGTTIEPSLPQANNRTMSRSNIIITGFMGTGKTTLGKRLAAALGYDFIDTDELIVARSGQTVEEIFHEQGEAVFREKEAVIARELGDKEGLVISTGGRTMLDPANAATLGKRGRAPWMLCKIRETFRMMSGAYHFYHAKAIFCKNRLGMRQFPQRVMI